MKRTILALLISINCICCSSTGKFQPTAQQQAVATAAGLAAFSVVADAAANNQKLDAKVALRAVAAATKAGAEAAAPPAVPVSTPAPPAAP